CYCGKYKKYRYKGITCEKCGVEVTRAVVRRERMGHISLAVPVSHIWFLRTIPSKLSLMLDISVPKIEKVIYYAAFIVTTVHDEAKKRALAEIKREYKALKLEHGAEEAKSLRERSEDIVEVLEPGLILTEEEYYTLSERFGDVFHADRGAGAIRKILEQVNLGKLFKEICEELQHVKDVSRKRRVLRRLRVVRSFLRSGVRPEWMILTELPILPPDLRPMVALDGGRYATADLNDLYRRVINRNNRLKRLIELKSPDVIITNEKRMLQEAVDALIDNSSTAGSQILSSRRRPLKSLADLLKGKQGRFRQNLLGKRVDYSARSVIVVGPELAMNECGLPKNLALEMFRPFVINKIIERGLAYNIKQSNRLIEHGPPEVWAILEEVIENRMVLLNRAPTLHRLGVQAFKPLLIEDLAIRVPALVCAAFNADFDGDQMAVHLPLTVEAQYEARELMNASKNILKPADGSPIADPTKDIVLGCYALTQMKEGVAGEGRVFSGFTEATLAHEIGILHMCAKMKVFVSKSGGGQECIETTYGRLLFNRVLPKDFEFVNAHLNKKALAKLVSRIVEMYGIEDAHEYIDEIKNIGFRYCTFSGITWGMNDTRVPPEKKEIIAEGEHAVAEIESQFAEGLLTGEERREKVVLVWTEAREKIAKLIPQTLSKDNPVYSIIDSGARGSWSQPIQMMGMKGLVINPQGEIIELPVKSSYKEGLSVLEYFISTHGARKGSTDTALKTASAGYLTRRLVDVAQDVIIREEDCKTKSGFEIFRADGEQFGYKFASRLNLRVLAEDMMHGKKVIAKAGEVITEDIAREIEETDISSVKVRSPITCKMLYGICAACYGFDLSKRVPVQVGEAIGIVAAQSIGEPGTQLTMRTFHVGGVAGVDITHGLPRVEEIFEARTPKGKAPLVKISGIVEEIEERGLSQVVRINTGAISKSKKRGGLSDYVLPAGVTLYVKKGDIVEKGLQIAEGPLDIAEIAEYRSVQEAQRYIVNEVQKIYVPEGATISDKHIEIMVRQMFSRVTVKQAGDTDLTAGEILDVSRLREVIAATKKKGGSSPRVNQLVLGISRVALSTDSFLSAASFQETSRVLVNAAIDGRVDRLKGLKENVIIGKLIPVGTGLRAIPHEDLEMMRKIFLSDQSEGEGVFRKSEDAVQD
ncbi:MAG: DNA-directed RNA polymerase subunit beta', partial [Nanoarchaeota archaeon]|nr:DNA-directed RNA polymerase subunit beta' [Nanoarchaeota archaeon]